MALLKHEVHDEVPLNAGTGKEDAIDWEQKYLRLRDEFETLQNDTLVMAKAYELAAEKLQYQKECHAVLVDKYAEIRARHMRMYLNAPRDGKTLFMEETRSEARKRHPMASRRELTELLHREWDSMVTEDQQMWNTKYQAVYKVEEGPTKAKKLTALSKRTTKPATSASAGAVRSGTKRKAPSTTNATNPSASTAGTTKATPSTKKPATTKAKTTTDATAAPKAKKPRKAPATSPSKSKTTASPAKPKSATTKAATGADSARGAKATKAPKAPRAKASPKKKATETNATESPGKKTTKAKAQTTQSPAKRPAKPRAKKLFPGEATTDSATQPKKPAAKPKGRPPKVPKVVRHEFLGDESPDVEEDDDDDDDDDDEDEEDEQEESMSSAGGSASDEDSDDHMAQLPTGAFG